MPLSILGVIVARFPATSALVPQIQEMFSRFFKVSRPNRLWSQCVLGLGLVCIIQQSGPFAHAQTWSGGGADNLWSNGSNWGGAAPANNGTASIAFAGSTRLTPDMNSAWNINSLTFNSGAGAFILGSTGSFTLTIQGGGMTNNSTNTETINNAITLGAAQFWNATSGNLTFGGAIANGGFLLTIGGGANASASGVISGTGGLTKTGAGTLTLSGTNTYSGATSVSAGVLNIQNAAGLGATSAGTTVSSGAALQIQGGVAVGAEALTLNGSGIASDGALRNISGINSMSGAITLGSASTISSDAGTLTLSGAINNGGFLLTDTGAGSVTMSGVISGTGGLTKTGTGTLTLSGAASNTYSGPTTVSQGTLILAKPGAVTAPAITIGGAGSSATVQLNAAYQLYGAATTINSNGQLNLNNFSEFVGALTLSGGSIITGTGSLYLAGTITSNSNSVSSTMAGNYILYGNQIFNIASGTTSSGSDLIISGPISEFSAGTTLTKQGAGTLFLSAANTYTGGTTLTLGTLKLSGSGTLGSTSGALTVNGGTLDLNGTSQGVGNFTGSGGTILNNSTGTNVTLTIGTGNGTGGNYSGVIADHTSGTGTVALTKTGTGTITLSGANTYTGGTTFNAGTVSISSDANLGASSGSLTFNGGTLQATQNIVGSRAINMTGAGVFSPSFGNTLEESGAVSGNGNLSVAGSGTLILSGSGSNGTGTTTISSGVLSLRGTVSLGSGNLIFTSGLLELGNADFIRALGTGAGQVNMSSASGGAGFAAYGADRVVNLGGSSATVTWGSGNFVASGQPLYLGDPTADHMIDFQNPINLNGASRTITVTKGIGTGVDAKISGVISGTGTSNFVMSAVGFAPWNPGSLLLSNGNNSYAGTTTINAGTLLLGANATGSSGNTVLGSGATDVLVGNTSGALSAGLLTNGAFTISRNIRAQSGNTGTISIGGYTADASTFSGNIFLGTASAAGKAVTLTAASGGTVTLSGIVQDATGATSFGLLTKAGAGTVVLSGANTYSGGTTINAGTLSIAQDANLGAIGGALTLNAGTLEVSGAFSTSRSITLGNSASTFQIDPSQTYTVTSAIGGSGALNKTGSGTMVLSGANTYTGGTNVSAGTLRISASERLANTGALTVSGGTFDLQTFNETVAGVTLSSGSITGSGTGTLTGSSYAVQSGTVSAILAGTAALTKTTAGLVTLSGANTYTGGTAINGGTLYITSSGAISSAGTISFGGGTLEYSAGNTTDYSSRFSTAINQAYSIDTNGQNITFASALTSSGGSLTKLGSGTLTLSGANSYNGGTTVSAGTLQMSAANRLLSTGALTVSGGTFDLQSFNQTVGAVTLTGGSISGSGTLSGSSYDLRSGTISAIVGGAGAVTKSTSGSVTLSGSNLYTGSTSISAGTLQINTNNALGTVLNGTTVSSGAALKLNSVNYSTAEALALNGSGISGGGALTNTGTSTFAGAINIATNATISAGGGTLNLTGGISKNGTTLMFAGGGTINIMTNGITGSSPNSDLVVDGTTVVLDTPNSYNGPTTIQNSGTIQLGANNVLPSSPQTAMTVNTSSTFDLASYSDGVASLAGDSTATVKNSVVSTTSTLTANPGTGVSTTFAGVIAGTNGGAQGNIALVKTGAGTMVLTGANTFSGSTTVSGGTLLINGNQSSATGAVTVSNNGSIVGGTGTIGGAVTVNSGAIVLGGSGSSASGTLTIANSLTLNSGSIIELALGSSFSHSTLAHTGSGSFSFQPNQQFSLIDLSATTGTYQNIITGITSNPGNLSGWTINSPMAGTFSWDGANIDMTLIAVPEPSTYAGAALALIALVFHFLRHKRNHSCSRGR